MSIQKATGTSPWKYRAAIVALCACAVSLRAQSTLQDKPVPSQSDATQRLQERVTQLESEVSELSALVKQLQPSSPVPAADRQSAVVTESVQGQAPAQAVTTAEDAKTLNFFHGTTINVGLDTYYAYNFNHPIGRVNLLRAYDVLSNNFNLSQASVILDHPPDIAAGHRWGGRLDLQFGQATDTLQGNPSNEPRPDIYRNIFQAYGTYIVPVGKGLNVDFGKWGSSLGIEGNYTKDQMNYSRSYWFNFLPFYHMGARLNYKLNDKIALNYWITNGTQQTEPFNGFKDQLFGLNIQPHKNVAWTVNYYLGQEHPDVQFLPNYTGTNLPTAQGIPFEPIPNPPSGKLHIFDSYLTWQASPKLTLGWEGDYVIERLLTTSSDR